MSCRTCKFLDVQPDKSGRFIARKHKVYPCTVVVEQPKLPACMTKTYDYRWPLRRNHMQPDDGEGCPFYQQRGRLTP